MMSGFLHQGRFIADADIVGHARRQLGQEARSASSPGRRVDRTSMPLTAQGKVDVAALPAPSP
ncbi:hypothetical protein WMF38_06960 [Sorangium sp. So ce118]